MPLAVEAFGAERDVTVGAEATAGVRHVGVREEVAEPRSGEVLVDAGAHSRLTARARVPGSPRAVRAFRQPTPHRIAAEQPAVLGAADGELEADALVPPEQWQVAVGRRGADDFESALLLERTKRGENIPVERVKQRLQPGQTGSPESHEGGGGPV